LFIGLLLVPLLLLAMCAAARLFLMSAAMRAHLLEPLERMPMRQAFTRLQDFHWVTMLRESGQLERWRDMSRSTEGIRQILNDPDLPEACRTGRLTEQKETLEAEIAELQQHVRALRENGPQPDAPKRACEYMQEIEQKYAACAESILCCILLPYWLEKRHNLMQSKGDCAENEPNVVLLAEEFLAIRYVAFIRAVLAQMRYLLLFITVALVLVMLAINSYPFQPKQEIAWVVTGLFLAFSAGIIMVLAQMHRNPLLSRITDKEAHELGATFYLRVAGFGAVPLITWLATQYPSIGGLLYSIVKPGLDVMK
jgi:DNA-binding transcriptional MerR regulator